MTSEEVLKLYRRLDTQISELTDAGDLNAIDLSELLDVLHAAQSAVLLIPPAAKDKA